MSGRYSLRWLFILQSVVGYAARRLAVLAVAGQLGCFWAVCAATVLRGVSSEVSLLIVHALLLVLSMLELCVSFAEAWDMCRMSGVVRRGDFSLTAQFLYDFCRNFTSLCTHL